MMEEAGWLRTSDLEFEVELADWRQSRAPLNAAMGAAFVQFGRAWPDAITSKEAISAHDPEQIADLRRALLDWAASTEPEWYD
jgi:hypothetical protein